MNDADKKPFAEIWGAALQTGGRDASVPMLKLAFNALAEFSFEQVQAALGEHVAKSARAPTPADIREIIEVSIPGGRPGAEEAWSIALGAMDEAATVVWTEEMAAAWGVAHPLMQSGDKVGARMAFRETYNRKVDEAKRRGETPKWTPSLGHDQESRRTALQEAVDHGRLTRSSVEHLLPSPATQDGKAIAGLITGKTVEASSDSVRKHLSELRKKIAGAGA